MDVFLGFGKAIFFLQGYRKTTNVSHRSSGGFWFSGDGDKTVTLVMRLSFGAWELFLV